MLCLKDKTCSLENVLFHLGVKFCVKFLNLCVCQASVMAYHVFFLFSFLSYFIGTLLSFLILFLRVLDPVKVLLVFSCFLHSCRPVMTRLWLSVLFTNISGVKHFCLGSLTEVRKYLFPRFSALSLSNYNDKPFSLSLWTKRQQWNSTTCGRIVLWLVIFAMYIDNYLP